MSLPDEMLILIAENLSNQRRDLGAFGCACARLAGISDCWFYRKLIVRTNAQAKCLLDAVKSRPARSNFMREMVILPTNDDGYNIPNCLSSMPQAMHMLQHLMIELPCRPHYDSSHESEVLWQQRFSAMFEDSSIITFVPKPHALYRLRSCM